VASELRLLNEKPALKLGSTPNKIKIFFELLIIIERLNQVTKLAIKVTLELLISVAESLQFFLRIVLVDFNPSNFQIQVKNFKNDQI